MSYEGSNPLAPTRLTCFHADVSGRRALPGYDYRGRDADRDALLDAALEEHVYRVIAELFGKDEGDSRGGADVLLCLADAVTLPAIPSKGARPMTSTIRVNAVHAVREGHVDESKAMAATMVEMVETVETVGADEPGYLCYEWFLGDDERTCHIVGLLEDSAAVMAHLTNMGETMGHFSEFAPATRIEIYGDVADESRRSVAPFGAGVDGYWTGFTRWRRPA